MSLTSFVCWGLMSFVCLGLRFMSLMSFVCLGLMSHVPYVLCVFGAYFVCGYFSLLSGWRHDLCSEWCIILILINIITYDIYIICATYTAKLYCYYILINA